MRAIKFVIAMLVLGGTLPGCQFNLSSDIVNAEKSIVSLGVNVSRLTDIDEIPVNNISYVNRG